MNTKQKHTSGYKIPKDYFNSLEKTIETQLFLETYKNSGFKTPEGYLDSFKVNFESKPKDTKVISIINKKNLLCATSIAAAIVLLFTITITRNTLSIDKLENQALENYLVEEFNSNEFEILTTDIKVSESDFISINSNNLENYIENLDIDDLTNY